MKSLKLPSFICNLFCLAAAGAVQAQSTKTTHAPGTLPAADHAAMRSLGIGKALVRELSKARDNAWGIFDYLWIEVRFDLKAQCSCGF